MRRAVPSFFLFYSLFVAILPAPAQEKSAAKPRARDLGVPFDGTPGPFNAITDVSGVLVGHTTLISGAGKLAIGKGPVRKGSPAILPRGKDPVMITNTHSVGVVRDAVIQWRVAHGQPDASGYWWSLPVVAETWDGWLNDVNGFHVKPEHAFHAI